MFVCVYGVCLCVSHSLKALASRRTGVYGGVITKPEEPYVYIVSLWLLFVFVDLW